MKPTPVLSIVEPTSSALLALEQGQERAPERIGQALARWQNVLIEVATLLVIGVSALITAKFFGWGSADWVVDARAAVYAGGVDIAYYVAVTLTRVSLTGRYWSRGWAAFWIFWALFWGAFSWMNNLFFVAGFWQVQGTALARTGIPEWFVLHVAAGVPQAIVVMMAFVPRRQEKDTRTAEQKYQEKLQKLQEQAYNADIRQKEAELRGKNVRAVASAYLTGKSLAERTAADQAAQGKANQAERERTLRATQLVAWGDVLRELAEKHRDDLDMTRFAGHDEVTLRSLARWLRARGEDVPSPESLAGPALVQSAAKSLSGAPGEAVADALARKELPARDAKEVEEGTSVEAESVQGFTIPKAAKYLDVSPGTLRYYAKEDYTGSRSIRQQDLITLPNGTQLLTNEALFRLERIIAEEERAKSRGTAEGKATIRLGRGDSQGRIPAVTGAQLNGKSGGHVESEGERD